MAQYDLIFTRNDHATAVEFTEVAVSKPTDFGYFLTQNPTTGALLWTRILNNPIIDGTVSGTAIITDLSSAPATNKLLDALTAYNYMNQLIGANDAMVYKGGIDCSANPNYPAGQVGWTWKVTAAGKIGGASGTPVEAGDTVICSEANGGGTEATVGSKFTIIQGNIDGALYDGMFSSTGLLKRTGVKTYAIVTDNSTNWNTAFGWGNHASAGYASAANLTAHINDSTKHVPANGTTNNKKVLTATATAGTFTWAFVNWDDIINKPDLAGSGHTHVIADINGLQTALDGKLGVNQNAVSASKLLTPRTIAATGDATWSVSFDGSANVSGALTLANVVTAGTYAKTTVNAKGLVTGGSSLVAADIPNLDASKITSGVFAVARIPNLPISHITGLATALAGLMSWATVPSAHNSTGSAGSIAYDSTHVYVCVATNTWRRSPLAKW